MAAAGAPRSRATSCLYALGLARGVGDLVEVTSFTLMALLIARQGTLAAASHQIAANLTGVIYMVPLSLGIATSTRVSYWRGAGDEARRRRGLAGACA